MNLQKKYLLENGTDTKYGARTSKKVYSRYLEDELSDMILKSELKNGDTVEVSVLGQQISIYCNIKEYEIC